MMKKRKVAMVLLAILVVILVTVLGVKIYDNNFSPRKEKIKTSIFKQNKNQNFLKPQEINGLKFEKINCTYDGKISNISYEIKNVSDHEITFFGYDLKVLDKEKQILSNVNLRIKRILAVGEMTTVTNEVPEDVSDAYSMDFKIIWEEEVQDEAK